MFPSITTYPKFVADQLLTSDALNNLFTYVDEQERMTRTNLLGVGIVCGLHVKMNAAGTELTITAGTGITTHGYLVSIPETTFAKSISYTIPATETYFNPYKTAVLPNNLELWELKLASSAEATDPLTATFLADKSVLIYVELIENHNLTCDPDSCDDKGISVAVSFRPFLVKNSQALHFITQITNINATQKKYFAPPYVAQHLPELRMRRFDVPSTGLVDADDIFEAYRNTFLSILTDTKDACTKAYDLFSIMVRAEYPANPFLNLNTTYAFLHNNTATLTQKLHSQYYYDFFFDLQQAYMELREYGLKLLGYCCPDPAWFPKHLLLGEVYPSVVDERSARRHYFICSPLFEQEELWTKVRLLFKRLALMVSKFSLPAAPGSMPVKITPGPSHDVVLSKRPIPYYFTAKGSTIPFLYKYWNIEKRIQGKPEQILSYNAGDYNTTDAFITNPLNYELNDCQFLRIEGIIGRPVNPVYNQLKNIIKQKRLPVKVVALRASEFDIEEVTARASEYDIEDLEISYDLARREWEAVIGKTIEYLHDHYRLAKEVINEDHNDRYENFLRKLSKGKKFMVDSLPLFIPSYTRFIELFEDIEAKATEIRNDLHNLIIEDFFVGDGKDVEVVREDEITLTEDIIDHFDDVIMSVKKGPFRAIYQEYQRRVTEVYKNLFLKEFLKHHPGIQHRAGVPMGGTFILVYHKTPSSASSSSSGSSGSAHAVFQGKVVDSTGEPISSALVMLQGTTHSTYTNQDGEFTINTNRLPVTLVAKAAGYGDRQLARNRKDENITFTLTPYTSTTTSTTELVDETIIADFYLPYLCCGDGRSIEFVINEAPEPVNQPPVARAGEDITITLPDNKVTLHGGTSTDPDGEPLEFSWTKVSGPSAGTITNATEAITLADNLVEGVYNFKIKVKDRAGATSEDAVKVTVIRVNQPPRAHAGDPDIITLPTDFYLLDGSRSTDPENRITGYLWTKLSGPAASFANAAAEKTFVTGLRAGIYIFELRVTDDKGAPNTAQKQLIVKPEPVKPVAKITASKTTINAGENVHLDGRGSTDPGGNTASLRFEWKQLSGGNAMIPDFKESHTDVFNITTTSVFQLKVTDNENQSATASVEIKVNAPAPETSNCLSIPHLISRFSQFNSDTGNLAILTNSFVSYSEIARFFTDLGAAGTNQQLQMDLFKNVNITGKLLQWLEELDGKVAGPLPGTTAPSPLTVLAITLHDILMNLAMYIACFQPEDFDEATVKMDGVFAQALGDYNRWRGIKINKAAVQLHINSFTTEVNRIKTSGEHVNKLDYAKTLDTGLSMLNAF